ncbi:hypothetical protein Q1695_009978 [Nippostrongylus brasiliensis]|nr:hypothetical protein Q1695_009978 [Nippostrongylus brasiliensis]
MRRAAGLLLVLLAAGVSAGPLSPSEATNYARLLLNPCTACHVTNALKQNDGAFDELSQQILSSQAANQLPAAFQPHLKKVAAFLSTEIQKSPIQDCVQLCKSSPSKSDSCSWLLERASHLLNSVANEADSVDQHKANTAMVTDTMNDLLHGVAAMIDPKSACGLKAPSNNQVLAVSNLFTNTQFLNCQLCYSLLQFLNTVVAGGQTHTSQTILADIGVAAKNVCVAVNLPALLHLLVPGLGDLNCDGMPEVIIAVFEYVLSPMFGAQAQETCSKALPYCKDVFGL